MTSVKRHSLAALTLSLICAGANADDGCKLVGAEKINRAFPTGAPWIALDDLQEDIDGIRCQFATSPLASGNIFVDTKNMFVLHKRLMASADAKALVLKRMEIHMKDASYEVRPVQVLGGNGFLSLHKSKTGQTIDALFLIAHYRNAIVEESLYLQGVQIGQSDKDAAEALMRAVLHLLN